MHGSVATAHNHFITTILEVMQSALHSRYNNDSIYMHRSQSNFSTCPDWSAPLLSLPLPFFCERGELIFCTGAKLGEARLPLVT